MKRPLRLLVIGGVAAGTRAASKARRDDPSMEITILTEEEYISYAGCGLAYYIGGVVERRESLFARSPEAFREKQGIEILLRHRAERIDTYDRVVHVTDLRAGTRKSMPFDRLLIATGAVPLVPPIEGIESEGIFTLRTVPDAEAIRSFITERKVRNAAVVGGGYIGVEVAENLASRGIPVTVFEVEETVLPRMFDPDMAATVGEHMESKGVSVLTGTRVERFLRDPGGNVRGLVADGREYECGMVVLGTGVRPNVGLARDARIRLGPTGAIAVDERMETSARGIYAAGDCAETTHLVTGKPYWLPLGSTANKMGRVAGANIAGGRKTFPGVVGTAIVKAFDLAAGRTGLTEKEAKGAGFNPVSSTVKIPSRAAYYPGGGDVTLKLIADRRSRRVIGAQAVGAGTVAKAIDTVAAALTGGLSVEDMSTIDIAYSPPFSPVLDAVVVAAHVLEGKM